MGVYSEFRIDIEDVFIEGDRRFDIKVIGASNYQDYLGFLSRSYSKRGCDRELIAKLHYENGNPYDCNAIRVVVSGRTVGYLSPEDSKRYRKKIERADVDGIIVSCKAIIVGGERIGLFKKSEFSLHLDLPIAKL